MAPSSTESPSTSGVPSAPFEAVRSSPARRRDWLGAVRRYGFAKLTGGPAESGALLQVAALFGYVRETNYGKWFEICYLRNWKAI